MLRNGILMIISMMILITIIGCTRQSGEQVTTVVITQQQEKIFKLLNRSSETIFHYAKNGSFNEARMELERYSDLITKVSFQGVTTIEGVNALTQTVVEAQRIFNRVQISVKDALRAATQIRLISDALTHLNNPMWLEYEDLLKQDAEQLKVMVSKSNDVGSLTALQKLHSHYLIIQPAIKISRDSTLVEKVNSLFQFLIMQLSQGNVNYTKLNQGLIHLPDVLNELFESKAKQTTVPLMIEQSNVLRTTFIASIIIMALAYVAWRRYRVL